MSNRKLAKTIQTLSREIQRLYRSFNRTLVNWLLRSAFVAHRRGRPAVDGFVLPITILLLLVVTLTVGAMTLRAFDRNVQVISESQQKVIYNAATPAIDRARSKLEFLFDSTRDPRYPGGVPYEDQLMGMLTNDGVTPFGGRTVAKLTVPDASGNPVDPYTLPDEKRVDVGNPNGIGPDGKPEDDTTWRYRADTDGDGKADATVVYSIVFRTPRDGQGNPSENAAQLLFKQPDSWKAQRGIVRGAPISNSSLTGCGAAGGAANGLTTEAWFEGGSSSSTIRKNFQVNAMVIPDNPKSAAVTLEFQQDRQIQRGNKWGAWFRYDLEIFPGPQFNWNGAMHTEGSLILGNNSYNAYLVSSPASCLYQKESSVISVTNVAADADRGIPKFIGQAVVGLVGKDPNRDGSAVIHIPPANNIGNPAVRTFRPANDASNAAIVSDISSDPASIVLTETTRSVNADRTNTVPENWARLNSDPLQFKERIVNESSPVPYVDDLYRADDRYGPKPKYKDGEAGQEANWRIPAGAKSGDDIPTGNPLIENNSEPSAVGLDGYWERRARAEGLRVLIGERLELGNLGGWVTPRDVSGNGYIDPPTPLNVATPVAYDPKAPAVPLIPRTPANPGNTIEFDGDPLYPPTVAPYPFRPGTAVPHLTQQRRSLRDNLPAVQAAAVYHAAVNRDYPVACLASTVHPGTIDTLRQSTNFMPTSFKAGQTGTNEYLLTDFFTGRGTDGWEFTPPGGGAAQIATQLGAGQPLRIALDNLANFAGDPDGAFPPKQEAGLIHPYPAQTMWGNFSNLRRALVNLDRKGYANLSIADKSYIHTAACTLGMLAYEIDTVQKFDPTNAGNNISWNANTAGPVMLDLANRLTRLMNGVIGPTDPEVLPKAQLSTYFYDPTLPDNLPSPGPYNARDYDNVPPEAYISALKQQDIASGVDYLNDPVIRMAELIMMNHQIRRDRTFGFRPSPAFGEYAVVAPGGNVQAYPSACDPDLFAIEPDGLAGGTSPVFKTSPGRLLKPMPAAPVADNNVNPGATLSGLGLNSLSGRRLALSRLCGGLRVPAAYNPAQSTNTATGEFNPAARPVVMPKFPALYYVFPEVAHGLRGSFEDRNVTDNSLPNPSKIADRFDEWDHRQPGAISAGSVVTNPPANRPASLADDAAVLAGLDPYDREPYVVDTFINNTAVGSYVFRPVVGAVADPAAGQLNPYPIPMPAAPTAPTAILTPLVTGALNLADGPNRATSLTPGTVFSRLPYAGSSPFPTADLSVRTVAVQPRQMNNFPAGAPQALLPNYEPREFAVDASPNRIQVPKAADPATTAVRNITVNSLPTTAWAVPFLDRAMFDGRQLEVARVMDIDWAMLRSNRPAGQVTGNTEFSPDEPWLPMSGVVYAFREDAVREDGIARPVGSSSVSTVVPVANISTLNPTLIAGRAMNLTNPTSPFDPAVQNQGISIKSIDHLPDPDRRIHGFRMRNGAQLKRNPNAIGSIEAAKNIRGLSFFTDQPVYMQGDFNLHQEGTGNETSRGNLLEEFTQRIFPDGAGDYGIAQFYTNRTTRDPKFANLDQDRWRPTEILADAISILSSNHCDGSIADTFVNPTGGVTSALPAFEVAGNTSAVPDPNSINRTLYGSLNNQIAPGGLYQRGCDGAGPTSFSNQNRITQTPPIEAQGWQWDREGAGPTATGWADFTTPVQIGRLGEPLVIPRPVKANSSLAYLPVNYGLSGFGRSYANPAGGRPLMIPADTRMNAIVVSGLTPSRPNQSYGGLHNFPRFLENWGNRRFFFSGSFLQLNFSNYATSPFELEGLEPGTAATTGESIPHYSPPNRLWGYDVALQFTPAGPAAARFVTQLPNRSEFYTEPPITDPYINRLCVAAKGVVPASANLNCPTQQ